MGYGVRVAGCELRVTGCRLRVAGCPWLLELNRCRVQSIGYMVEGKGLRAQAEGFSIGNFGFIKAFFSALYSDVVEGRRLKL